MIVQTNFVTGLNTQAFCIFRIDFTFIGVVGANVFNVIERGIDALRDSGRKKTERQVLFFFGHFFFAQRQIDHRIKSRFLHNVGIKLDLAGFRFCLTARANRDAFGHIEMDELFFFQTFKRNTLIPRCFRLQELTDDVFRRIAESLILEAHSSAPLSEEVPIGFGFTDRLNHFLANLDSSKQFGEQLVQANAPRYRPF